MGGHYQFIIKIRIKSLWHVFKSPPFVRRNVTTVTCSQKKSLCALEPCLNVHFYRQHLLLPVEWIWSAEAGAGMLRVMWPGCSSKLNASSGSNQKGHSVGGRGRGSLCENGQLESGSFTKGLHTRTESRSLNTQSCWFREKCPSVITLNSLNASQVTAKTLLLCFIIIPNELGVSSTGLELRRMCLFLLLKKKNTQWHWSVFGICTTIMTLQCTCSKQPSCWRVCHVWHTSTNAHYFSNDSYFKPHRRPVRARREWRSKRSTPAPHMLPIICCL